MILNAIVTGIVVLIVPPIFAALSLAIPPKIRSFGYAVAALWILPGLLLLPIVGALADEWGIRTGLVLMVPVFLVGADGGRVGRQGDREGHQAGLDRRGRAVRGAVRAAPRSVQAAARPRCLGALRRVQVLFNVDLEIDEGEIVALLGTNGAGKSTLLKAITGLVEASEGAIVFDGRDMTYTPPDETAGRGVTMAPGGAGVFPSLTVRENLQLAGWLHRKDKVHTRESTEKVLDIFPILRERLDELGGNLSGGQQQMLTLGMAFIEQPRLLMIDELSLGLAPSVVSQLLEIVRELKAAGTTIILVEQSVNVALDGRRDRVLHGEGRDPVPRPDRRAARAAGRVAVGVPRRRGNARPGSRRWKWRRWRWRRWTWCGDPPRGAGPARPKRGCEPLGPPARGSGPHQELRRDQPRSSDVSYAVAAAEIVGFLGPNGAGKTTLFDVISGFTPQDSGTIMIRDTQGDVHDISRTPAQIRAKLGLGRSFQDGRLFPALTVTETIAVALECSIDVRDPLAAALHLPAVVESEAKIEDRVEELIDLMGLGAFRDKFVHELSTGSRRIVDLACILGHQPTVLLLDEPSSGIAQREAEALGPLAAAHP